jgi:hypothetical protein
MMVLLVMFFPQLVSQGAEGREVEDGTPIGREDCQQYRW